jgi:hypothetical protein
MIGGLNLEPSAEKWIKRHINCLGLKLIGLKLTGFGLEYSAALNFLPGLGYTSKNWEVNPKTFFIGAGAAINPGFLYGHSLSCLFTLSRAPCAVSRLSTL